MDHSVYEKMFANEAAHWWFKGRRDVIKTVLDKIPFEKETNNIKILDVGTCTGYNLELLNNYGNSLGIDTSEQAMEFCQKNNIQNVSYGDAVTFKLPQRFDL